MGGVMNRQTLETRPHTVVRAGEYRMEVTARTLRAHVEECAPQELLHTAEVTAKSIATPGRQSLLGLIFAQ